MSKVLDRSGRGTRRRDREDWLMMTRIVVLPWDSGRSVRKSMMMCDLGAEEALALA